MPHQRSRENLPTDPIMLDPDLPPVVPMEANPDENESLSVTMRRGSASDSADVPVMFILTDENEDEEDATGARLLVLGISITWVPRRCDGSAARKYRGLDVGRDRIGAFSHVREHLSLGASSAYAYRYVYTSSPQTKMLLSLL